MGFCETSRRDGIPETAQVLSLLLMSNFKGIFGANQFFRKVYYPSSRKISGREMGNLREYLRSAHIRVLAIGVILVLLWGVLLFLNQTFLQNMFGSSENAFLKAIPGFIGFLAVVSAISAIVLIFSAVLYPLHAAGTPRVNTDSEKLWYALRLWFICIIVCWLAGFYLFNSINEYKPGDRCFVNQNQTTISSTDRTCMNQVVLYVFLFIGAYILILSILRILGQDGLATVFADLLIGFVALGLLYYFIYPTKRFAESILSPEWLMISLWAILVGVSVALIQMIIFPLLNMPAHAKRRPEIEAQPNNWMTIINQFLRRRGWLIVGLIFSILLYLIFFGINFNPLQPSSSTANDLLTKELTVQLGGGINGNISIRCLYGEAFGNAIVQGDILKCKMKLQNVDPSIMDKGVTVYVISGAEGEGQSIPDYENNNRWYNITLYTKDFNQTVEQFDFNNAYFWVKVPPTKSFTFAFETPGYYLAYPQRPYWYITTELKDYIESTLVGIELLALVFGSFAVVNYWRELWYNNGRR